MNFSPALNTDYLFSEHNVRSSFFELTEVVRQKAESGVILNANHLRKALQAGVFNQLDVDLSYPDVTKVEYQDLMPRYLESCGGKINGDSIVIAHANSDVADYNRRIREHFFPGNEEVMSGDKVMAVANSDLYGIFISNGDFGLIRQVLGKPEKRIITLKRRISDSNEVEEIPVPLVFRDVMIGFKNLEGGSHFFQAKILEELLYNKEPGLSSDQNKALYLDFCIRNKNLTRKSVEFKHSLMSDPYFNALRLKFGYAITCHKAQGSEWDHVFVKCKTHLSPLTADYFRWFYTAITRTSQNLH
ncbi:MAG: ATP-binding domain-containing protein, partial [Chlorobium sp.]|nr:ATP-binding domain-containing protein [Chlorobium sp.]